MNDNPAPTPDARPRADVILYDGRCPLCRRSVARLARWDRRGELAFLAIDDPSRAARFPHMAEDDLYEQMHLVDRAGRVHRGAAALRVIARRVPRLWPLVPLLHVPGSLPLWQWLYRAVARRRYGSPRTTACEEPACRLHGRPPGMPDQPT